MGRKYQGERRRAEIVRAFALVLAEHGYAGATTSAVAERAGFAPGIIHHYFASKQEILNELLTLLLSQFRSMLGARDGESGSGKLGDYIDSALKLDHRSDTVAARCWVGVLAEGLRDPELFARIRSTLDAEIKHVEKLGEGRLDGQGASALLAYVLGSLVFGAFAPKRAAGFAATHGKSLLKGMSQR